MALIAHKGEPPDWCADLAMAETWHIPPWQIEERVPAVWADRFLLLAEARYERDNPKQIGGQAEQGKHVKRLVSWQAR
jgi:hypothetical protein